jgi:hypothetical protein
MRIGYISGIIISGMIWLAIGCMLTFKGVFLLGSAIISTEKYWLIETLTRLCKNRDQATMFLVFIPVFIGILKGRLVLSKSVEKFVKRLLLKPSPIHLKDLFSRNYLILIFSMMMLGVLIRFSPISIDIRGCIDLAIGSALVNGAFLYFKQAFFLKAEIARRKK